MSGFPRTLYNFEIGIDALASLHRDDCALCLFIYGPGHLRSRLEELSEQYPWVILHDNKTEQFFNTFLKRCDLLLRLTQAESFGISVWDAKYWDRKIIASDVCERPKGTRICKTSVEEIATSIASVLNAHGSKAREQC